MAKLNYGRMDQLLKALGFTYRTLRNGSRGYEHANGARMSFLAEPDDAPVLPHELALTRVTLDNFGFAVPDEVLEAERPFRRPRPA